MASTTSKKKRAAGDAYCPHCHLLIEKRVGKDWPEEPQRCPHCRLLVGAGRARPTPATLEGPGKSLTLSSVPISGEHSLSTNSLTAEEKLLGSSIDWPIGRAIDRGGHPQGEQNLAMSVVY